MKKAIDVLGNLIFWLWNLAFLSVVYLGILPYVAIPLFQAAIAGAIPFDLFLSLVGLIAVPTICSAIPFFKKEFIQQPNQLIRLFYGVEAPLFLLCLLRLFLIREVTPASMQLLSTLVICVLAFFAELAFGYAGDRQDINQKTKDILTSVQLVCHCFMLLTGLWVGGILLFYTIPLAPVFIWEILQFRWVEALISPFRYSPFTAIWWVPISILFFGFSTSLFVVMPYALTKIYLQAYNRIVRLFANQYGATRTWVTSVAVVTAWAIVFINFQQQPQTEALALLKNPPRNDSEKQALLAKSDLIQKGLVNAYLYPYRYLSTWKESNQVQSMYQSIFKMPPESAQTVQNIYNYFMSPFLYNGEFLDNEKAAELYAQFLDVPIQKAERTAIQTALQSTYNQGEAKAGLLNINEQKVWLANQQVSVTPQGDWADVELAEVYQNQTFDEQEVFYYFSLPESAALTGVWLGNTDKRADAFTFVISPRGAAQKVYNAEVRQRVDPALLEQVGPRQYRLRAFPVPRKPFPETRLRTSPPQEKLYLWLTYKVMQQSNGWPLPQLAEKRNVFWTGDSQRVINGQKFSSDKWLPDAIPAVEKPQPIAHEINFTEGYRLAAKPLNSSDYALPQGQQIAVVLDTSRSMSKHTKEVQETFAWLKEKGFADGDRANNDADLYVTAIAGLEPQRQDDLASFDPAKFTFYGTLSYQEMLQQFVKLRGDTNYDAVLVVTDEGSYELNTDPSTKNKDKKAAFGSLPPMPAPVWMVHLGGKMPPAYQDATLKAIQDSGGGVSAELPELMQRLATKKSLGNNAIAVADGYGWFADKIAPDKGQVSGQNPIQSGFEQIAAKYLILNLSKDKNQLGQLDAMHAIAKRFGIVTPYSSMIVLVNDRQKEALKKAEKESDRFDRKVESGKEQLTKPMNPLSVSAVPEPEEWLLLGLLALGLIVVIRQRRLAN